MPCNSIRLFRYSLAYYKLDKCRPCSVQYEFLCRLHFITYSVHCRIRIRIRGFCFSLLNSFFRLASVYQILQFDTILLNFIRKLKYSRNLYFIVLCKNLFGRRTDGNTQTIYSSLIILQTYCSLDLTWSIYFILYSACTFPFVWISVLNKVIMIIAENCHVDSQI